jgi:dTMP kinase
MKWAGRFITLEGGEGTGKTTQAKLLAERLTAKGSPALLTREPGGVNQAEDIRQLLLAGAKDRWSPISEALMMYAARAEHWRLKIEPALMDGQFVICDRFADSTMAYQGIAGGVGADAIAALHRIVLGDVQPDLTLIFDLPVEVGLQRAAARVAQAKEGATRFEQMDSAFHARLTEAFRVIAAKHKERCVAIDAAGPVEDVAVRVWSAVSGRLGLDT